MTVIIKEICPKCKGTGIDLGYPGSDGEEGEGKPCENCDGSGQREVMDSEDLDNRLSDLEDKADSIVAEQALQREDLTAALEAIWNKVKNL